MWLEFAHPLYLLLAPVCGLIVWLTARRWPSRTRKARISHILRYVLVALTALALSGASVLGGANERAAWLLVDASASLSGAEDELAALANEALAAAGNRKVGVIAFGGDAMVEVPLSDAPGFGGAGTAVDASASNLGAALSLAGALLPSDASGGIAVISDGIVDGAEASALQARGIPVNALKLEGDPARDAQVTGIDLPGTAYQGQALNVTVTIHSTVEGPATVILLANRSATATREVALRKGENSFVFRDVAADSGVLTYEAQVVLPGDGVARNDRMGAYVAVSGAPGILLVEGARGDGAELQRMLAAAGMAVETVQPEMLPSNAASIAAYHAVALVNVDADALSEAQIGALGGAVKELGRGLAVFGGDRSYALGNYRGSPLEELLPVTIDVKNRLELPTTALVLVIDKSGSMTAGQYGVTRLDVAKEAACRAVEVLTELDQAGVIAFDDQGKWVVPLAKVADAAAMQEQIGTIRPGGGTAFYTPLAMALDALTGAEAQHKHVIFLTDGEPGDQGYERIAKEMADRDITLTTVAVGEGADVAAMRRLAEVGGGRAYAAGEFDNLPKIFTKETLLAAGTYVQNRNFTPLVADESLTDFDGFPQLTGYLTATERPLATVSLVSDRDDPILAWWQYGAGRALCWMSDVQGGWSEAFLAWEDASAFFGGLLSHVLPAYDQAGEMVLEDGALTYAAPEGADGDAASARIVGPDGEVQELVLEQVSPSRYEARVETGGPGAYAVQVQLRRDGEIVATLDGGAVVPYAREYDLRQVDTGALEALCAATGGAVVTSASELMQFPDGRAQARHALTPWLMVAALVLLLIDIAQRRLNWEQALPKRGPREAAAPQGRKSRPRKPREDAKRAQPAQTSEQLWQNLQHRKRL